MGQSNREAAGRSAADAFRCGRVAVALVLITAVAGAGLYTWMRGRAPAHRPELEEQPEHTQGPAPSPMPVPVETEAAPELDDGRVPEHDRVAALLAMLCPQQARRSAAEAVESGRLRLSALKAVGDGCREQQTELCGDSQVGSRNETQ